MNFKKQALSLLGGFTFGNMLILGVDNNNYERIQIKLAQYLPTFSKSNDDLYTCSHNIRLSAEKRQSMFVKAFQSRGPSPRYLQAYQKVQAGEMSLEQMLLQYYTHLFKSQDQSEVQNFIEKNDIKGLTGIQGQDIQKLLSSKLIHIDLLKHSLTSIKQSSYQIIECKM